MTCCDFAAHRRPPDFCRARLGAALRPRRESRLARRQLEFGLSIATEENQELAGNLAAERETVSALNDVIRAKERIG